jgi:hypothetical protein
VIIRSKVVPLLPVIVARRVAVTEQFLRKAMKVMVLMMPMLAHMVPLHVARDAHGTSEETSHHKEKTRDQRNLGRNAMAWILTTRTAIFTIILRACNTPQERGEENGAATNH